MTREDIEQVLRDAETFVNGFDYLINTQHTYISPYDLEEVLDTLQGLFYHDDREPYMDRILELEDDLCELIEDAYNT